MMLRYDEIFTFRRIFNMKNLVLVSAFSAVVLLSGCNIFASGETRQQRASDKLPEGYSARCLNWTYVDSWKYCNGWVIVDERSNKIISPAFE